MMRKDKRTFSPHEPARQPDYRRMMERLRTIEDVIDHLNERIATLEKDYSALMQFRNSRPQ